MPDVVCMCGHCNRSTPVARLEERPLQREPGSTPGGSSTYRYRDPERRKAYMRNLMRARRGK
jgi:hypothetical protein